MIYYYHLQKAHSSFLILKKESFLKDGVCWSWNTLYVCCTEFNWWWLLQAHPMLAHRTGFCLGKRCPRQESGMCMCVQVLWTLAPGLISSRMSTSSEWHDQKEALWSLVGHQSACFSIFLVYQARRWESHLGMPCWVGKTGRRKPSAHPRFCAHLQLMSQPSPLG